MDDPWAGEACPECGQEAYRFELSRVGRVCHRCARRRREADAKRFERRLLIREWRRRLRGG